jgi:hypothetical protein
MKNPDQTPLSRRDAMKWLAGTAAAGSVPPVLAAPGETEPAPPALPLRHPVYDPDFTKPAVFPWEKQFTEEELRTTAALADLILPKDDQGPSASEAGVPAFVNEWCSAPYEENREAGEIVRGGLAWLNTESFRRFEKRFDELASAEQTAIVDSICDEATAPPELQIGARFFKRFRQLCLGGYYTNSSTWKGLGYVGNVPIAGPYPGPPPELIERLGLQDVV